MPVSRFEFLAAERAEFGVVHLALYRRELLQRGAPLARHRKRDTAAVAGVDPLEDETALLPSHPETAVMKAPDR